MKPAQLERIIEEYAERHKRANLPTQNLIDYMTYRLINVMVENDHTERTLYIRHYEYHKEKKK